jgi:uncharacterized protein YecE (DUF72 family)
MERRVSDQLSLFHFETEPDPAAARLQQSHEEARALAVRLPADVRFGTSSWSFPGWAGLVYSSARPATTLAREGLREYARHPLLRTVGIDRSYYAPIPDDDLAAYADQLPAGFRCCIKAPSAVTALTSGRRHGETRNPDFLSVDRLADDLLGPLTRRFAAHTGPIILEFPPFGRGHALEPAAFLDRLEEFAEELPPGFEYAVELRDRSLLTPQYRTVLTRHRIAHTYNYWSAMPMPEEQAATVPPNDMPFAIVRLLLRPGTWYEDQRDAFQPFNRIVAPDPVMRRQVLALAGRALQRQTRVYILVNNKAEGSSPLTVLALARDLADAG